MGRTVMYNGTYIFLLQFAQDGHTASPLRGTNCDSSRSRSHCPNLDEKPQPPFARSEKHT